MKVRTKFLFIFLLVIILFLISHFTILSIHNNRLNNLISKTIQEEQRNFTRIFDLYSSELKVLIYYEYGQWDDVVHFVYSPDKEFAEENFGWMIPDEYFDNICIYDTSFTNVYSAARTQYNEYPEYRQLLESIDPENREIRFFDKIDDRICEVIATTIERSDKYLGDNKYYGYIIAYREFSEKYLNDLATLTNSTLEFNQNKKEYSDYKLMRYSIPLYSWDKTNTTNINVSFQSEIYRTVHDSSTMMIVINAIFSLTIISLFLFVFIRLISKPLNRITYSLHHENPNLLDSLSKMPSEYGEIAGLIKSFFNQKDTLQKEIDQRKHAENSLHKLNQDLEQLVKNRTLELQSLIHQSPLPIGIYDSTGKLVEYNSAYSKILMIKDSEEIDLLAFSNDVFRNLPEYFEKVKSILREGGNFYSQPIIFDQSTDNSELADNHRWIIYRLYSTASELNSKTRIINIIDDVTKIKMLEFAEKKRFENEKISLAIFNAQEEERKRVSRELHDSIGQKLSTALMKLEIIDKDGATFANDLEEIKRTILGTGKELRSVIKNLRPADLDDYGLIKSLKLLCDELNQTYNIDIVFNSYSYPEAVDRTIELNIYRIVQEALNNIIKHSNAIEASVQIYHRDKVLYVNIEDNGKGTQIKFDDLSSTFASGYGLLNMKRRAESLNGNFYIESSELLGTEIQVKIPLEKNGTDKNTNS